MACSIDILKAPTVVRGLIGEQVAKECVTKQLNMIVQRPARILTLLNNYEEEIPPTAELKFFEKYHHSMDFMGFWPRTGETLAVFPKLVVNYFQSDVGLMRFMSPTSEAEPSQVFKPFIIEVKSNTFTEGHISFSPNQITMFKHAEKLGIDIIIPVVVFLRDWRVKIRLKDRNLRQISPSHFAVEI
ncbi:MAG: hypothetical protein ACFFC7_14195 [Candidatus Hermodarchaeota archaeon]